jgi:hypothetical protein
MLDSIILKGGSDRDTGLIDAGLLAESLIYYGRVRLILGGGTIAGLVRSLGRDLFAELTTGGLLDVTIQRGHSATVSTLTSIGPTISYGIVDHGAKQGGAIDDQGFLELHLTRASGKTGWSRRHARRLVQQADRLDMSLVGPSGLTIPQAACADLQNPVLVQRLVGDVLQVKISTYTPPPGWYCRVAPHPVGGFVVETNLDLRSVERSYLKDHPDHKVFGIGDLLGVVVGLHEELFVQCHYSGDLQTNDLLSRALRTRIDGAIERVNRHRGQVDRFQEILMPNGRRLREAVNAGEVDFRAVLKLHGQRERFSDWVRRQPPDSDLLRAYFEEMNRTTLFGTLPPKWMRFFLFTGVPTALATTVLPFHAAVEFGLVTNIVTDYLCEKLSDGWKPNQFVEKLYRTLDDAQRDKGG